MLLLGFFTYIINIVIIDITIIIIIMVSSLAGVNLRHVVVSDGVQQRCDTIARRWSWFPAMSQMRR